MGKQLQIIRGQSLCCRFQPDNMPDMGHYVKQRYFMNEQLKLAKNTLFLLHTKETHSLGQKREKKNVPGIGQHNSRTLIFSSYHEGQRTTGMFKKNTRNS